MRTAALFVAGFLAVAVTALKAAPTPSGAAPATRPAGREDRNPGHLKMALVDLRSVYSDTPDPTANKAAVEANLKRHLYFVDRAAADGAEFVGFPELSVNGYHFSKSMTWLILDGPEVGVLKQKAAEKGVYIAAGIAEQDAGGKRWNTHFVVGPDGQVVGWHHKAWLTKEKDFVEPGTDHNVFEVKGVPMGISTCADGTDRKNLQALADNGARIIYGPHANTTGGTTAGWYKFRAAWGGADGWVAQLKVYAALHNHAGLYNGDFDPPAADGKGGAGGPGGPGAGGNAGWASGAWFIGPDGQTLAQMPASTQRSDSKEFVLVYNVPVAAGDGAKHSTQSEHSTKGLK